MTVTFDDLQLNLVPSAEDKRNQAVEYLVANGGDPEAISRIGTYTLEQMASAHRNPPAAPQIPAATTQQSGQFASLSQADASLGPVAEPIPLPPTRTWYSAASTAPHGQSVPPVRQGDAMPAPRPLTFEDME